MRIRSTTVQFCLTAFVLSAAAVSTFGQSQRKVTQLADGVYEIQHEPNGNTTVIIGERQVFVVDTCFLPSAAREDIAQIRKWTDKPVSFVLNTHFHNDHNLGNRPGDFATTVSFCCGHATCGCFILSFFHSGLREGRQESGGLLVGVA
jgi:Metallo-beta-lactamase superfamily